MSKNIAVIGANNLIGREILTVLHERDMSFEKISAVGVNAQLGDEVSYGEGEGMTLTPLDDFDFDKVSHVINAAGSDITKKIIGKIKGAILIDLSSALRMDPDTPLIVSGVNEGDIGKDTNVISTPNCVVTAISAALKPLSDKATLNHIHAVTFQSVSGVGKPAIDELFNQTRSVYMADTIKGTEFPKQIAFNVLPQIGSFMDDRTTSEEWSVKAEIKKVLGGQVKVTATCTRVPVFMGHAAALHLSFNEEISALEARDVLRSTRGITVIDVENEELEYMTQQEVQGEDDVYVSRIREDSSIENGLCLWVVADNIHSSLALNAVKILEKI